MFVRPYKCLYQNISLTAGPICSFSLTAKLIIHMSRGGFLGEDFFTLPRVPASCKIFLFAH